jgi:filamentous hemagglutinin
MLSSAISQVASGQGFSFGDVLKAGAVALVTQGLDVGLGVGGFGSMGAGMVGGDLATTLENVGTTLLQIGAQSVVNAAVSTAIEGGSFLTAVKDNAVMDLAAVGANAIGDASQDSGSFLAQGSIGYDLAHAALGCAASAAEGTGCAGGAIGGATSALIAPLVRDGLYDGTQTVTTTDDGDGTLTQTTSYNNSAFNAITAGIATLSGGLAAGLAGGNAQAGATAAENEALNNSLSDKIRQLKNDLVDRIKWTYADPAGDVSRWVGQFGGLMQSGAQQTMSQSGWSLALQGISNGISALSGIDGGLPPAGPDLAPVSSGPGQMPSSAGGGASPITPPGTPIQSSSNDGSSGTEQSATNSAGNSSGNLNGQGAPNTGKIIIDGKIAGQLEARGWTEQDVQAVVKDGPVGTTTDNRSAAKTPDGVPRNDSASVYGSKTGYVVVNDRTGEVVQVSGKNDPGWIPDSRITWK